MLHSLISGAASYETAVNKDAADEIEEGATTASDYCLMLTNLPPETTKVAWIASAWTGP